MKSSPDSNAGSIKIDLRDFPLAVLASQLAAAASAIDQFTADAHKRSVTGTTKVSRDEANC